MTSRHLAAVAGVTAASLDRRALTAAELEDLAVAHAFNASEHRSRQRRNAMERARVRRELVTLILVVTGVLLALWLALGGHAPLGSFGR
jgi:hypothetical protein